jgi:hypothetical protein
MVAATMRIMKSSFLKFVLMVLAAVFLGVGAQLNAADTTVDTNATPGTDAAAATKPEPNNPPGPDAQNPGTPVASPDSKTGSTVDANHATSVSTPAPGEGTKKHKKHRKHQTSGATTTTSAPAAQ